MIIANHAPALSFWSSRSRSEQQSHSQRFVLPQQSKRGIQFPVAKATDTVLFGGATPPKAAFNLKNPPKGYSVGEATQPEVSEVVNFIETTFGKVENRPTYERNCRYYLDNGGYSYIIRDMTKRAQPIIATATLDPNGYIFAVAVDKEHQGQGIATAMMKGLVEKGKQAGLDRLHLGVEKSNPQASTVIKIYEKAGFAITAEDQNTWIMVQRLKPLPLHWRMLNTIASGFSWLLTQAKKLYDLFSAFIQKQTKVTAPAEFV